MSIFGDVAKAFTNSGFGQKVIKVAKDVKRVATNVTQAIAGEGGIVSQAYGKIKSFGSMVLDKVFPNASQEEVQALQAVTSSSAQAGGTEFVQNFSGALKSAQNLGPVKPGTRSITQQVQDSYDYLGGNIQDATKRIYKNTIETLGVKQKPNTNIAETIVKKSKIDTGSGWLSKSIGGSITTQATAGVETAMANNPEFLKMANFSGGRTPELIAQQAKFLDSPGHLGSSVAQNPEFMKMANFGGTTAEQISKDQTNFLKGKNGTGFERLSKKAGGSLLDAATNFVKDNAGNIASSLASGFETFGELSDPYVASSSKAPSLIGANRFGVGGKGSSGGDFLTQAQRAFQSQQASQLERIG
jgi:hypothetical protein